MTTDKNAAKLKLISAMVIFGTIGIFVKYIPMSSSAIASVRGIVGMVFLLIVTAITGKRINLDNIKKNAVLLLISGACIGANWIFLFEAYRYTTVATATLCYYLAPVFVTLVSPVVLKEKLTPKKLICVIIALIGMVFVSGILDTNTDISEFKGILCGISAAVLYASVVLMNQKIRDISAYDKTIVQLGSAGIVVLPYALIAGSIFTAPITPIAILLLSVVAIVHTGIAYTLYFGSMKDLNAQTVAIFSYIDPVVAIILSAVILKEPMTLLSGIGAVLILGSTLASEFEHKA